MVRILKLSSNELMLSRRRRNNKKYSHMKIMWTATKMMQVIKSLTVLTEMKMDFSEVSTNRSSYLAATMRISVDTGLRELTTSNQEAIEIKVGTA